MQNIHNQDKIKNFSIIAHIDHGKSTLADRMLEQTHSDLSHEKRKERVLDRLDLEQEKGITIKLQAATMNWKGYELNLIDTPGHVDFSYEVSRSLAACEAVILLVDAQQGIQAQTISNTRKALDLGLTIIPVINKIDIPFIDIPQREADIHNLLGLSTEDIVKVSAKTGEGVDELLDAIVEKTPVPSGNLNAPLKALIFDSFYDEHRGVVVAVRVFDGKLSSNSKENNLFILQKGEMFSPTEIGIFAPDLSEQENLQAGNVGYIATGLKDIRQFTVGDTISNQKDVDPLPGYKQPKPNVFASFFPVDSDGYESLKIALNKLALNDASLVYTDQRSNMLGSGFRCGFLGLLHMEIIQERLEREYDVDLVITAPTVEYHITKTSGEDMIIQTPHELPDPSVIAEIREPWVRLEIMTPDKYIGAIMDLAGKRRGQYVNTVYLSQGGVGTGSDVYIKLEYDIPLSSLISNFFDTLKNISSGYASMEYEFIDFFPVDLVKVAVLVNKEEVPALSFLETREEARLKAAKLLKVMKEEIPRQQFQLPLQASIGAKVIAREDVSALRKDVTAKLYGGDVTRRMKLLEKQKKGKKKLRQKMIGRVNIPQEAFLAILKT
ncbi:MAG: Elongation factor 4 [candidate division WS6 bacterium GW2011_GWF2_39_15]|uniref:Elongation factor 4 n=1 Tax=candidate division WS6 bacterium GW2011_GWF2_39_15 TaxID=1619100 RepID=A0A0G0MR43_9BACT|nr:MAG: Elongation factor 4 [candidate division WS6 bacterium GW2011_GWF2_39_15]